jgi:hypothetical protein
MNRHLRMLLAGATLVSALVGTAAHGATKTRIELSAPLFPDMRVFQKFQAGAGDGGTSAYAQTTTQERIDLVTQDVKSFPELLELCAPKYPAIKLWSPGDPPLTASEISANYDAIASCGYLEYGAKPYWVPQHVSDVDMCGLKLGADWRLPTEEDLAGLTEADFTFFADILSAQPAKGSFPSHIYYNLETYIRGTDGSLKLGDFSPGSQHVRPLETTDLEMLYFYSAVRCIRVTEL